MVASVAVVTAIHMAVIHDRLPVAQTIQRLARRLYLPAYVLLAFLNVAAAW